MVRRLRFVLMTAIARSGVFDSDVARFRFYLLTLTAPSFGKVHRVLRSESSRLSGADAARRTCFVTRV